MQRFITYPFLLLVRLVSRIFWRFEVTWVGEPPAGDRWRGIRICAILNHTSLYEWVFAGAVPPRFLRRIALHGVVPVAAKTLERPLVGAFFRRVAAHVVPLSRDRRGSWRSVLGKIDDPKLMVVILPEGRMMRRTGLDGEGRPMSVRGGIADLLQAIPEGRMLLAYSGGLHHVQAPGEHLPRLFRTVRMSFELVDVRDYRERLMAAAGGEESFRRTVMADMDHRLVTHCPVRPETCAPRKTAADRGVPPPALSPGGRPGRGG
ncbi:MAG TPA: 1-acyl-sn-glycerol-3-phosphate acyltransferase [Thermoanaerobaculia bacterium]|nr:1-acyl-sn-glycerol-3-phosphate acyltransferase [Thermoanaerobaculia bacterium]